MSGKDAVAAVQASRALKSEVAALDHIVRETSQRFAQFHGALAADGAALNEVLTRDMQSMRALRAEIRCEADAIVNSVGKHVKNLHDAAGCLKTETVAVHRLLDEQMGAFGKAFACAGSNLSRACRRACRRISSRAGLVFAPDLRVLRGVLGRPGGTMSPLAISRPESAAR